MAQSGQGECYFHSLLFKLPLALWERDGVRELAMIESEAYLPFLEPHFAGECLQTTAPSPLPLSRRERGLGAKA
jgi:hypothetical protein